MKSGIATGLLICVAGAGCVGTAPSDEGDQVGVTSEAITAPIGTLKKVDKPMFWSGTVGPQSQPDASFPPECQGAGVECEHFKVKVSLPAHTFDNPNRPGGVQFAIRWFGEPGVQTLPPGVPGCCGEFDALNLYVYKGGQLRGSSVGIISTAAATTIDGAENGTYDVYIASDPTFNIHPSVDFSAYADVQFAPRVFPTKRLLPDLEFRSARTITFSTPSFPFFETDPPPGSSCFDSEVAEDGAHNCLRFDQVIANVGKGAAELRLALPKDPNDTSTNVAQRVYSSDGSTADQPGGTYAFHPAHQHYHYKSFTKSELWASDGRGRKLGTAPVKEARKVSFCVADVEIDKWGKKNVGDRKYNAPDCLFPQASDANFDYLVQGQSAGWSDIYEWYIPGQYIEVTGVTDGLYVIESCADPDSEIEEAREDNNCSDTLVRLTNMGTPGQHAENLGQVNMRADNDDGGDD